MLTSFLRANKLDVVQINDAQKLKVTHKNKILHAIYLESFIVKLYSPTL